MDAKELASEIEKIKNELETVRKHLNSLKVDQPDFDPEIPYDEGAEYFASDMEDILGQCDNAFYSALESLEEAWGHATDWYESPWIYYAAA